MQPLIFGVSGLAGHRLGAHSACGVCTGAKGFPTSVAPPVPNSHWGKCQCREHTNWGFGATGVARFPCTFAFCQSSLLRSSTARVLHRAGEEVPHLPFPTLTLSRGAGFPRQNHVLPYLNPTTTLGCLLPFLFPMQEASEPGESGDNRKSNSSKRRSEAFSFVSITCRLPAAKLVWHSCFPQSSNTFLCMCRSKAWKASLV